MKPPPRARVKPNCSLTSESENRSGKVARRWQRAEQKKLLRALQRLPRTTGAKGDIDCAVLAKYVPTRSISEVTFHSSLASMKWKRKMWEEKKVRKPIEDWTNMASAVTGTLEEAISKAFSQVHSHTTLPSSATNLTPVVSTASSTATLSSSAPSSCSFTHPTPPLSSTAAAFHSKFGRTSKYATKDSPRTFGVQCVVDFERIYRFLSVIHNPSEKCHLTSMESAIVLDLLMSLPEQLPLLDCNKLRKHLIQVQSAAYKQTGHSSNTSGDADMTGCCPPLNPFMVPLKLLMNREVHS
uniref:snRNA-activating protein complex subunit 2 n=1 Tax=Amphiprion percula TaxID=161767 RepID=A0A3P8SSY5_AMPPE